MSKKTDQSSSRYRKDKRPRGCVAEMRVAHGATGKAPNRAATLRDVAMAGGASPSTVSIVLSKAPLSQNIPTATHD